MTSETPIKRIQILGERCSGTNYLEKLLKKNLIGVKIGFPLNYKHTFLDVICEGYKDSDDILFVVIYRNFFDWVRSLFNNPQHVDHDYNKTFSSFIRSEWKCTYPDGREILNERNIMTMERFKNIFELRKAKLINHTNVKNVTKNYISINYEHLKKNYKPIIKFIADKFKIKMTNNIQNITTYKGLADKPYVDTEYFDFDKEDISFIAKNLDAEVETSVGYDVDLLFKIVRKEVNFKEGCADIRTVLKSKIDEINDTTKLTKNGTKPQISFDRYRGNEDDHEETANIRMNKNMENKNKSNSESDDDGSDNNSDSYSNKNDEEQSKDKHPSHIVHKPMEKVDKNNKIVQKPVVQTPPPVKINQPKKNKRGKRLKAFMM